MKEVTKCCAISLRAPIGLEQLTVAQQALATLCSSSREFIVSAPAHQEDLELTPSPLLAPYALQRYTPPPDGAMDLSHSIRLGREVERYAHEPGLPWPEPMPLPAGTRAIELQSRCPFRAYAQLRLGAEPLETPVPGITPRERGRLLHRALELLWRRLGDSRGLTAARVVIHADTSVHPDLLNSRLGYVSISRASHEATVFTDDIARLGPSSEAMSRDLSPGNQSR